MNKLDLFFVSIYYHFCQMKDRGRKVVPWFQTCATMAIFMPIIVTLLIKVIFKESIINKKTSEGIFLFVFMAFGAIVFFTVKIYFFKNDKHIRTMEKFLKNYTDSQRRKIKYYSIGFLMILPFIFIFILWLQVIRGF